jgi:ankyrin repeat protein
VVRGSIFSAILHGLLLAVVIFGLPRILSIPEDEPAPTPQSIEVATVTPQEADALAEASRRLTEAAAANKGSLTADAANSETPADGRPVLQSSASASARAMPEDREADERAPQTGNGASGQSPQQLAEAGAAKRLPERPAEASAKARAATAAAAGAANRPGEPPSAQRRPAAEQAADAIAAASLASPERNRSPAATTDVALSDQAPSPSGAAIFSRGSAAARALLPLVADLPLLDGVIGESVAAQARSASEAAAAADSLPAMAQTIARMQSAAEQGYTHAQFSLAEIYLTGRGRPRDAERGLRYLQRASMNGYAPAQLLLAALSVEGSVVPENLAEASAWLSLAADQGNRKAAEALARLEPQLSARDSVQARQRRSQLRQIFILSSPKPDPQSRQRPTDDQLRVATTLGDEEAVYLLLGQGADADRADEDGRTPAIEAAWRGYGKVLTALLDQGADLLATDATGKSALVWAAINGHGEIAERLIDAEVPVDQKDREGMTALMRAAWNGHADVVARLLRRRADPNLRDRRGRTALDYARVSRNGEAIRLLQAATRS